jgi:choline dehydrogenase
VLPPDWPEGRPRSAAQRGPSFTAADRPPVPDRATRPHPAGQRDRGGRAARNSPLTEFSGIGPADELRSAGVEALQDLPGVGRNLHDHPLTSVVYPTIRDSPAGLNNLAEVLLSWRGDPSLTGRRTTWPP